MRAERGDERGQPAFSQPLTAPFTVIALMFAVEMIRCRGRSNSAVPRQQNGVMPRATATMLPKCRCVALLPARRHTASYLRGCCRAVLQYVARVYVRDIDTRCPPPIIFREA